MLKEPITSRDNSRLKHARAVRDGRVDGEIFVEGARLAEEAVDFLEITDIFYTSDFAETERGIELLKKFLNFKSAFISQKLLESISDTKTPQGVVLLARKPKTGKKILEEKLKSVSAALFIVLHELNNPANAGAILRTAEAAGAAGAILTRKSADVFAPKSLRAAMGAAFRLPLWTNADFEDAIEFFRAHKIKTVCADIRAAKKHTEIDWRASSALIVGSEARGLTPEEIAATDEQTKIPMKPTVESLNAAVAAGIVLYEAARQRNF